jgi:hypothetical protein
VIGAHHFFFCLAMCFSILVGLGISLEGRLLIGLATKNEPILISFERSDLPGFENLEGLGQEN